MNYVISIINPLGLPVLTKICDELAVPLALTMHGYGTAEKSIRDLLGIDSNEKRVVVSVAGDKVTERLIKEMKKRLYIDAPGNGIVIAVPIKSVGGKKTLEYLEGGDIKMKKPEINFNYELITVVANEGFCDVVMDAARSAGATGGTTIHAKGTGSKSDEKFHSVSIAQEKELVLILAKASQKAAIMSAILTLAGPSTAAGAVVFSQPVSQIGGFSIATD